MRYQDGSAFRQALEDRLRRQSLSTGEPLTRLRKFVAFDRFLARLVASSPGPWRLKGGFALQLRIGQRARTTKDIDLSMQHAPGEVLELLRNAAQFDLGDWFSFEVERGSRSRAEDQPATYRFPVHGLLDGRTFERFHVDVGLDDIILDQPEPLRTPPILSFAGIDPTPIPGYPLSQQLAEKVHAYTREYRGRYSSRVRDLADMLLIGLIAKLESSDLKRALQLTFEARSTHRIPSRLPDPPARWGPAYRRLQEELELTWGNLGAAVQATRDFIEPVLSDDVSGVWNPERWRWQRK